MAVKGWLKKIFGFDFMSDAEMQRAITIQQTRTEIAVRELAYQICVKRIAKAISKCEFRTYKRKKEEKKDLYYLLNVSPNPNQNATQFWEKLIHQLYDGMEAVIIPHNDGENVSFYVADSFTVDDTQAFKEHIFSNITINGLTLRKKFKASEVYYFQLQDDRVKMLLESTLDLYKDLISTAFTSYKRSNGSKFKLVIDKMHENNAEQLEEILNEDIKAFLESDSAAFPQYDGYDLQKFENGGTVTNTRDLKALIDDVLEITCKALLIPTNIMTGEVTDTSKAVDDFLTFCLDSLVELIQDELNRKTFEKQDYLKGSCIKVNTQTIKHIDILDMANAIDKLLSSGVKTINDINRILGDDPIDEDWANQHYMTRNYAPLEEVLNGLSGGKEEKANEDENAGISAAGVSGYG